MKIQEPIINAISVHAIRKQQLKKIEKKSPWTRIGAGSYADVYAHKNGKDAMKVQAIEGSKSLCAINELRLSKRLTAFDHPNLVAITRFLTSNISLYTEMELCEIDLFTLTEKNKWVTSKDLWVNVYDSITSALLYLHEKNIVHGDIKLENILMKGNVPKLSDYGFATEIDAADPAIVFGGSEYYMAPEKNVEPKTVINFDLRKCDIWSFGITMFALHSGTFLATNSNITEVFREQKEKNFEPVHTAILGKNLDSFYYDLLKLQLMWKPELRMLMDRDATGATDLPLLPTASVCSSLIRNVLT